MPEISVVIPLYDAGSYILDAIASLQKQTFQDFEVIIVDNNCTDRSNTLARSVIKGDSRFRFSCEKAQGIARAMNHGVKMARGQWVCFLDQDDFYLPDMLARMHRVISRKNTDMVACRGYRINERNEIQGETEQYFYIPHNLPLIMLQLNIVLSVSYIMIARDKLRELGPFPDSCSFMLDWHMMLEALVRGFRISLIDTPLVGKRYHGNNASFNLELMEQQAIPRLLRFIDEFPGIRRFFSARDIARVVSERYVNAMQYLRRHDKIARIPGYLAEYHTSPYLKKELVFYWTALAYMLTDQKKFRAYARQNRNRHALAHFIRGLDLMGQNKYRPAAKAFEQAFIKAMQRFPEALNSLAIAWAHLDKDKAREIWHYLLTTKKGDYLDAKANLEKLELNLLDQLRHTYFLTPGTQAFFLET
jgi:glycosyltransferase involved in cell wall biosynthesis